MRNILMVIILSLSLNSAFSQSTSFDIGKFIIVTMANDNVVSGKVLKYDDSFLYLEGEKGEITVPISNISFFKYGSIEDVPSENYRNYPDQYFILPSAFPVNKGQIYYRNISLVGNLFSFGFSEYFSLNAGFESISIFQGESPYIAITPKFSLPLQKNLRVAVGGTGFFYDDEEAFFLFSNVTVGDLQNHFTFGLGAGIAERDFLDDYGIIAGMHVSLSNRVAFVAEYITTSVNDDFGLLNAVVRVKFKGNVSVDFGANIIEEIGIPTVALTLPIND